MQSHSDVGADEMIDGAERGLQNHPNKSMWWMLNTEMHFCVITGLSYSRKTYWREAV